MTNNYDAPEMVEIGNAKDLVLGSNKLFPLLDDGPGQPRRWVDEMSDEE